MKLRLRLFLLFACLALALQPAPACTQSKRGFNGPDVDAWYEEWRNRGVQFANHQRTICPA
ncbi:MAG: hypothetical protein ACREEM_25890 [Blastocatellia bacterium]